MRSLTALPDRAIPVRWLHGEGPLRTYLAQRDHCLDLYCRARTRTARDPAAQSSPEVSLGCRRSAGAARPGSGGSRQALVAGEPATHTDDNQR